MKLVGIGLNKTGTTTLASCFQTFGYKNVSCRAKAFNHWLNKDWEALSVWLREYDSFVD